MKTNEEESAPQSAEYVKHRRAVGKNKACFVPHYKHATHFDCTVAAVTSNGFIYILAN
jgi:hypothetical protein